MANERLQILGSYGLECIKAFPELFYANRDGYHTGLTMGDARGLKTWRLSYEVLNDDDQCLVTLADGTTENPHTYYARFFDRHHAPRVPFTITCPEDGQDYTVMFADSSRSLNYRNFQVWQTVATLVQWRGDASIDGVGDSLDQI